MDEELDDAAHEVARLAELAQAELLRQMARGGLDAAAVLAIQEVFDAAFIDAMVNHLNRAPGAGSGGVWNARSVRAMQVGDISLSTRLYAHARQTSHEVMAIVRQHAQGTQQARDLALRLYDGYDPKDGIKRPLEGVARAKLPKALRELTANATDRASLQRVYEQGMRYAATLKTEPLKAAYMDAFRGWEQQQGMSSLRRRLDVAHREKTRFMANRIAQTELARAHQHGLADALMADVTIAVVQVVLSGSHPRFDVCDMHARADLFGLGPGLYPKGMAPRPTYHAFCRCRLRSRPDIGAAGARRVKGGEAAYLRSLPLRDAAAVMGSRGKLQAVLDGEDALGVVNRGVPDAYRTVRLGDVAGRKLVATDSLRKKKGPWGP